MGFPIIPNSVFGRNQKDETDIFYPMPSSVGGSPKLPDKIDLDRLPISSMPLSVRGSVQGSEPSRQTVWPLASGIPPKLMPSNYRPNDIFHQSPALKRTGRYSYSSVDDDEEEEIELSDEERRERLKNNPFYVDLSEQDDWQEPEPPSSSILNPDPKTDDKKQKQVKGCVYRGQYYVVVDGNVFNAASGRQVTGLFAREILNSSSCRN